MKWKKKAKTKIPILKYRISVNCFEFILLSFSLFALFKFRASVPNLIGKSVCDKLFNSKDCYYLLEAERARERGRERVEKSPICMRRERRALTWMQRTLLTMTETCTKTLDLAVNRVSRERERRKKIKHGEQSSIRCDEKCIYAVCTVRYRAEYQIPYSYS